MHQEQHISQSCSRTPAPPLHAVRARHSTCHDLAINLVCALGRCRAGLSSAVACLAHSDCELVDILNPKQPGQLTVLRSAPLYFLRLK